MNTRVLLVEDEEHLLEAISMNLEMEGIEVVTAITGTEALKKKEGQFFNLIILDVMIPEISGFDVCERIRLSDADTPILFLTAKDSHHDKVKGLKLGADDYITKPFNLEELLLRVKVLIKHSMKGKVSEASVVHYSFAGNEINFQTFCVKTFDGREITLSKREAGVLKYMVDHKNMVVSRQQLLNVIWGYEVYPSTRTTDNFIVIFRRYFEKDVRNPVYFHSIRGVGYKFTDPPMVD